jgi:pimeloyl-ACP methyl ester carboxylesterase
MANANLLVPGTGGITLMDNHGNDIGWPVLMRLKGIIRGIQGKSNDELIELMSMAHTPGQLAPAKTSLKPGTSISPGHVLRVAYNQIPGSFNDFLYDWRTDLRYSAQQLLDFIVHRQPAGGRWNLVGHSQGGLLIVLASKLMAEPDDFANHVATATMIGAPVAGTLNAASAILLGDSAGARLAPAMRKVIRTWPGIHQMLPAWKSVLKADLSPAADARQLTEPGGWPGLNDIQADLLLRARQVQPLLLDPLGHMQGVDARFYFANNRKTQIGIFRPASGPMEFLPATDEKGDTLVPYRTTMVHQGGAAFGPNVTAFGSPVNEHAYLLDDPTVATSMKQRLV